MKIYVGNLSPETNEEYLKQSFGAFGDVVSASVVMDHYSGKSRGFAFVEMASQANAEAAIAGLNGKELNNRTIIVNEARPRKDDRNTNRGNRGSFGGGNRRY